MLVVTLSTQDNEKLLKQFKSGFKRTSNLNNLNKVGKLDTKKIRRKTDT